MSVAGVKLYGEWTKAAEILAASPADIDQALTAALRALAEWFAAGIKKKINSNVPPPNSPFTQLMKGSGKTLIDKGDLRNGVGVVQTGRHNFFVGIPRSVQSAGGSLASIADILENGRTIVMRMTPKQRRFLHATLGKKVSKVKGGGGGSIIVIHIPPRPFIAPVYDAAMSGMQAKFEGLFLRNLRKINPNPAPTPPGAGYTLTLVPAKKGGFVRRWVKNK